VKNKLSAIVAFAALFALASACNMSTANISSFKISKDKAATQETKDFKAGETIYAATVIANSSEKVTVKNYLTADDAPMINKGEKVPGSEVNVELPSSGTANYSLPIPAGLPGGRFTLHAEMINAAGETKDRKHENIKIEPASAGTSNP
jgi:hypothetical protein